MPPPGSKFYSARILERRDISDDLMGDSCGSGRGIPISRGPVRNSGRRHARKTHTSALTRLFPLPTRNSWSFSSSSFRTAKLRPGFTNSRWAMRSRLRKAAKGNFTLDLSGERANHLLIATVTGVSPFVSYVRSLHHEWKEKEIAGGHKLFILEGASRSWELGYSDELGKVAA